MPNWPPGGVGGGGGGGGQGEGGRGKVREQQPVSPCKARNMIKLVKIPVRNRKGAIEMQARTGTAQMNQNQKSV